MFYLSHMQTETSQPITHNHSQTRGDMAEDTIMQSGPDLASTLVPALVPDLEVWTPDMVHIDPVGTVIYQYNNVCPFRGDGGHMAYTSQGAGFYHHADDRDKQVKRMETVLEGFRVKARREANVEIEAELRTKINNETERIRKTIAEPLIPTFQEAIRIAKREEHRVIKWRKKGQIHFHGRGEWNMSFDAILKDISDERQKCRVDAKARKKGRGRVLFVIRSDIHLQIPQNLWDTNLPLQSVPAEAVQPELDPALNKRKYVKDPTLHKAVEAINDRLGFSAWNGTSEPELYEMLTTELNLESSYFETKKNQDRVNKAITSMMEFEPEVVDQDEDDVNLSDDDDGTANPTVTVDDPLYIGTDVVLDNVHVEVIPSAEEPAADEPAAVEDPVPQTVQEEQWRQEHDQQNVDYAAGLAIDQARHEAEETIANSDLDVARVARLHRFVSPEPVPADEPAVAADESVATEEEPIVVNDPANIFVAVNPIRAQELNSQMYLQDDAPQIIEALPVQTTHHRPKRARRAPQRYDETEMSSANLGGNRDRYNNLRRGD